VKDIGVILPGFIDLHNHLTWNVLPRWRPADKFRNRYQWQATTEYDVALRIPENRLISNNFGCKANIYAEIKALAGGSSSVTGSYFGRSPVESKCADGLTRNLDHLAPLNPPSSTCSGEPPSVLSLVANEVFPMEIPHDRVDWYRCQLASGKLRALLVHLSEGNPIDASARREFRMLNALGLLGPGLVIVHGTALGAEQFQIMAQKDVGLVWSPRSNDELYGATTDVALAMTLGVKVAIGPDWSPTGSSGMLQELNYIGSRHSELTPKQLVSMATSVPANLVRLNDTIGALAPGLLADLLVLRSHGDGPYETVVAAKPADVRLVVVGGSPVYGDLDVMRTLLPSGQLDELTVCGARKALSWAGVSPSQTWDELTRGLDAELHRYGSALSSIECQ
jgi:hypothetical protein